MGANTDRFVLDHWGAVSLCGLFLGAAVTASCSSDVTDCAKTSTCPPFVRAGAGGQSGVTSGGMPGVAGNSAAGAGGSLSEHKPVEKLDLLFVVDNSVDMAPHQALLAKGARELLHRLANPDCVATNDASLRQRVADATIACPQGFAREFPPIADMHVGAISSSLGGFGSPTFCSPMSNPRQDDKGHLIGAIDSNLPSYDAKGFWAWDPRGERNPTGESSLTALSAAVEGGILAVSASGCGYPATLEAWYRFLVSPDPYQSLSVVNSETTQVGTDFSVLAQRSYFLRPDSHVAIVMLANWDDCSILDTGIGWLVGTFGIDGKNFNMARPTSTCATDPNSLCCRSCADLTPDPPGCSPVRADVSCQSSRPLAGAEDPPNLRCFDQKRRFGLDLLHPIERYVAGLAQALVPDRNGALRPNGLFVPSADGRPQRSPGMVLVTSLVGVPWPAIAIDPSAAQPQLTYLKPGEFAGRGIWGDILGDQAARLPPNDPLLVSSIAPRSGSSPRSGLPVAPPSSTDPRANVNGHEYHSVNQDDLQYSCIYELPEPIQCLKTSGNCFCGTMPSDLFTEQMIRDQVLAENRPVCNPPGGGAAEPIQYFAGAIPPPRHLSFLKAMQNQARLGSICPRYSKEDAAHPATDPSFGYNPALAQVADWVRDSPR